VQIETRMKDVFLLFDMRKAFFKLIS